MPHASVLNQPTHQICDIPPDLWYRESGEPPTVFLPGATARSLLNNAEYSGSAMLCAIDASRSRSLWSTKPCVRIARSTVWISLQASFKILFHFLKANCFPFRFIANQLGSVFNQFQGQLILELVPWGNSRIMRVGRGRLRRRFPLFNRHTYHQFLLLDPSVAMLLSSAELSVSNGDQTLRWFAGWIVLVQSRTEGMRREPATVVCHRHSEGKWEIRSRRIKTHETRQLMRAHRSSSRVTFQVKGALPFIVCFERNIQHYGVEHAMQTCSAFIRSQYRQIRCLLFSIYPCTVPFRQCYDGPRGIQLQREAAQKTMSTRPNPIVEVPYLLINDYTPSVDMNNLNVMLLPQLLSKWTKLTQRQWFSWINDSEVYCRPPRIMWEHVDDGGISQ